jgi:hypothetical protein
MEVKVRRASAIIADIIDRRRLLLEHGYVLTLVKAFVVLGLGDLERALVKRRFPWRGPEKVPA